MSSTVVNKKAVCIRRTILVILTLSIIGLADSAYLTAVHLREALPVCNILEGCDVVLQGPYATLFGTVPIALLGVVYYGFIFFMILAYLGRRGRSMQITKIIAGIPVIGFIASLWFVYLQVAVIGSICEYCMLSAATSFFLFVSGMYLFHLIHDKNIKKREKETSTPDGKTSQKALS